MLGLGFTRRICDSILNGDCFLSIDDPYVLRFLSQFEFLDSAKMLSRVTELFLNFLRPMENFEVLEIVVFFFYK